MPERSPGNGAFEGARWPDGDRHGLEKARSCYVALRTSWDGWNHLLRRTDRPTTLDSDSPRRSMVMCALHRASGVTHEYQSDSSSKKPASSVHLAPSEVAIPPPPRPSLDSRSLHISSPWNYLDLTMSQPIEVVEQGTGVSSGSPRHLADRDLVIGGQRSTACRNMLRASRSTDKRLTTPRRRSANPRGVPTPNRVRITRPRFAAAAWIR